MLGLGHMGMGGMNPMMMGQMGMMMPGMMNMAGAAGAFMGGGMNGLFMQQCAQALQYQTSLPGPVQAGFGDYLLEWEQ